MSSEDTESRFRKRILVVEDDAITQRFVSHLLQGENYDVVLCEDGAEAVSVVMDQTPDLILLDLGLPSPDPFTGPQFDGFTVLDWLRRMMPGKAPPVIVLTARDPSVKPKVLASGAFAYFQKPADRDELLSTIQQALTGGETP